jgi:hypothetical protein
MPGYISSVESALQTLGGEEALEKALQDNALLKLRLRPQDPASHPLFGERMEHPGLVLRVARPLGQPDAAPRISVVCRTHASYVFTGLADYQYLGQDHSQVGSASCCCCCCCCCCCVLNVVMLTPTDSSCGHRDVCCPLGRP